MNKIAVKFKKITEVEGLEEFGEHGENILEESADMVERGKKNILWEYSIAGIDPLWCFPKHSKEIGQSL